MEKALLNMITLWNTEFVYSNKFDTEDFWIDIVTLLGILASVQENM